MEGEVETKLVTVTYEGPEALKRVVETLREIGYPPRSDAPPE